MLNRAMMYRAFWTYGIDAFYGIIHLLSIGPGLQAVLVGYPI